MQQQEQEQREQHHTFLPMKEINTRGGLVSGGGGRDRVEVIHGDIRIGADRMGHGPRILLELGVAHGAHVVNAADDARVQVAAELLVAVHCEPLLQGELEPVPTGDTVAGPVVEVPN